MLAAGGSHRFIFEEDGAFRGVRTSTPRVQPGLQEFRFRLSAISGGPPGIGHLLSNASHFRGKIAWHLQTSKDGPQPGSAQQHTLAISRSLNLRHIVQS